jgi:hypothetical protein
MQFILHTTNVSEKTSNRTEQCGLIPYYHCLLLLDADCSLDFFSASALDTPMGAETSSL